MSKKLFLMAALLGALTLFTTSCGEADPCKNVECANGTCLEGDCFCDPGYLNDSEGSCTIDATGVYNVSENCTAGIYSVEFKAGANTGDLKIKGFWEEFVADVNVTVDGNSVSIPRQEPDGDKFFVEGTGTWAVNTSGKVVFTINYTVKDETNPGSIQTATCAATFTRQ
jgi:hypothetical protein